MSRNTRKPVTMTETPAPVVQTETTDAVLAAIEAEDAATRERAHRKTVTKSAASKTKSVYGHDIMRNGALTQTHMLDEALHYESQYDKPINLVALADELGVSHRRIVSHVNHLIKTKKANMRFVYAESDKSKTLFAEYIKQ